jgi:hypothetical protein
MGDMGLAWIARMAAFGVVVGIPLTIWKLIDVIVWLYQHISI